MANRLAAESSPYLLQHRDNPVDWWPWGPEAFAEARRLDKPVFVSIGYAACHWCHVMAHESFEDAEIAAVMNELFVNVKVDREERPDVDAIYMNAIHVMGEGGGWPLSAFCTPDGAPFFVGTYFPKSDRYGRPGFPRVLRALSEAWRNERDKITGNAAAVLDGLRQVDGMYRRGAEGVADAGSLQTPLLIAAGRALLQRFDKKHGGMGGAPKFPSSSTHDLLGRCGRLRFGEPARDAFLLWARSMCRGGIYDHLGGGFARYAVDAHWLVPHFEKMLYDNGQLLGIVGDAISLGAFELRPVIDETVAFLRRELQHASGGLWSSLDADSEGEEGKFYVWTPAQIREVVGASGAIQFERAYGVTEAGNFEHHGTTVLSRVSAIGEPSDEAALGELRARLFEARAKRVRPGTDDKVLSGWNGLAISGLLRAWEASGVDDARALAVQVGEFLVREMMPPDGKRVARVWKDGKRKLDGTLDDYAFVAAAFLDLAEATGDAAWWSRASVLLASVRERFVAREGGVVVFYMTPDDPESDRLLVHRPESHHDGAIPSGAAVAVEGLLRLGLVGGDAESLALAETYLAQRLGGGDDAASPLGSSRLYAALDLYLHGQVLVVSEGPGGDELVAAARRAYAPTLLLAGPWASAELLEGKGAAPDGRARAYLCRGQTCSAPVTSPHELIELVTTPP